LGRSQSPRPIGYGRSLSVTLSARSGRHVRDAAAREGPDIEPRTGIVSAFGSWTRFAELRRAAVCLKMHRGRERIVSVRWRRANPQKSRPARLVRQTALVDGVNRFALAIRPSPMLETARIGGDAWFPQGCSSVGRVPVSKTGCRRFEPCRPCQQYQILVGQFLAKWPVAPGRFTPTGLLRSRQACQAARMPFRKVSTSILR
jgi:hypothetical protein